MVLLCSRKIYKTTTGGQWITNIELNSAEVPEAFELQQNYPNPFNNSTEIGFSIKNHSHYRLEVFDVLGQYADIIFDRVILPGVYSVSYSFKSQFGSLLLPAVFQRITQSKKICCHEMILRIVVVVK
ncbi:MAG: hypothetical protein IPL67_06410 [Ignavibacteria bacterium]|nr:hypothetical protein [Ignavibacteria bacterium]